MFNLITLVNALRKIGEACPNVNTVVLSDIYKLNELPDIDYSVFAIIQDQHRQDDEYFYFNFYLYYVDRLLNDKSNQLEIQSTGVKLLSTVLGKVEELGLTLSPLTDRVYQPFNQRFSDECSGVYVRVEIQVPIDCNIPFDILVNPILADLSTWQPGTYYPSDYGADAFRTVTVSGQSYQYYTEGYRSGKIDNGTHKLEVNENGIYADGQKVTTNDVLSAYTYNKATTVNVCQYEIYQALHPVQVKVSANTEDIQALSASTSGIAVNLETVSAITKAEINALYALTSSHTEDISALSAHTSGNTALIMELSGGTSQDLATISAHTETNIQDIGNLSALTSSHTEDIQTLSGHTENNIQNIETLSGIVSSHTEFLQTISASTSGNTQQINELSGQTESNTQDIETLSALTSSHTEDIQTLSANTSSNTVDIIILSGNTSANTMNITALSAQTSANTDNIVALSGVSRNIRVSIEILSGLTSANTENIEELSGITSSHTEDIQTLSGHTETNIQDIQELSATTVVIESGLTIAKNDIETLSGLTSANTTDIATISGLTSANTDNIQTLSGLTSANTSDIQTLSAQTSANTDDIATLSAMTDSWVEKVPTVVYGNSAHTLDFNTLTGTGFYRTSVSDDAVVNAPHNTVGMYNGNLQVISDEWHGNIVQIWTATYRVDTRGWPRIYYRVYCWSHDSFGWSTWNEFVTDANFDEYHRPQKITATSDDKVDFNDLSGKTKNYFITVRGSGENLINAPIQGDGMLEVVSRADEDDILQRYTATWTCRVFIRTYGYNVETRTNDWSVWHEYGLTPVTQ